MQLNGSAWLVIVLVAVIALAVAARWFGRRKRG
jgi:hypothetical protein